MHQRKGEPQASTPVALPKAIFSNGFAPCCPISVSPDVVGAVAAVKGTAAAQQQTALRKMSMESAMNIQMLRRRLPAM